MEPRDRSRARRLVTAAALSRPIGISRTGTPITPLRLSTVRTTSAAMPRSNCRSDQAKLLGGNASGVLARVIEGWQVGTVFDMSTGAPLNVGADHDNQSNRNAGYRRGRFRGRDRSRGAIHSGITSQTRCIE